MGSAERGVGGGVGGVCFDLDAVLGVGGGISG